MSMRHRIPTGSVSRRLAAVRKLMDRNSHSAFEASKSADHPCEAAALRGKATAYREAFVFIEAIERGRNLPRSKWRWGRAR